MRHARWFLLLVAALACDGDKSSLDPDPDPEHPPEITSAVPAGDRINLRVGDTVVFEINARDADADRMSFAFYVDGILAAKHNRITYRAPEAGFVEVFGTVSDGVSLVGKGWTVAISPVPPDTIPPAPVIVTTLAPAGVRGSAELEWMAVGDDGNEGRALQYLVHTSARAVLTEDDWINADAYGVYDFSPLPGTPLRATLVGLPVGVPVYVCVRAIDEAGNRSPLSECPSTQLPGDNLFGLVINPLDGAPLTGAAVSFGSHSSVTDGDGRFALRDFASLAAILAVRDETNIDVGAFFDCEVQYASTGDDSLDLFLLPVVALETTLYPNFLTFYQGMTTMAGRSDGTFTKRWSLPIDLYVPPFTRNGLDYRPVIVAVAAEFDALLGQPVFRIVDSAPGTGVTVDYVDGVFRDNYGIQEFTAEGNPKRATIQHRTTYGTASVLALQRVARHELGHAVGLNHSADDRHVMTGGPAPTADFFSADEVAVMRCFYGVARGWDNRWFTQE